MRRCGDGARERARCTVGDSRRETPAQPRSRGAPPLLPRQPDHPRRRARLSLKIWTGLASWAEGPRAEKATPPSSPRPLVTEDLDGSGFLGEEVFPVERGGRQPDRPRRRARLSLKIWTGLTSWAGRRVPRQERRPDHPRRRARLSLKIWTGLASWAGGRAAGRQAVSENPCERGPGVGLRPATPLLTHPPTSFWVDFR